jgi:glyoxylase-like metal-dependent hydrolase (beta-lactamase superfamily II)
MISRFGDIVLIQLSELDSNIYLIGNTLIDTGTGFNFTRLYSILKSLKSGFDNIGQIINTHAHFDHIGGNGYFMKALIAIHEKDAPVLAAGDVKLAMVDYFDGRLKAKPPDIILKDGQKIKVGNHNFEIIHTPGHTPGSICLWESSTGILFTGDTVFENGLGRTDIPGGDPAALARSVEKLSGLKPKIILPGHGKAVTSGADKLLKNLSFFADRI